MANYNPDTSGLSRRGRKPGSRNRATIEKEEAARATAAALAAGLTTGELADISPLTVLRLCMVQALQNGDLIGARTAAAELAPYCAPKMGMAAPSVEIPPELLAQPDPEPIPDEATPDNPVY